MKKILSVILAYVLSLASLSAVGFADEVATNYCEQNVPEGCFGIIVDENGNMVEAIPMPMERATYVDTVITLQPNNSIITYQYKPKNYFAIGFGYIDKYSDTVTTRNCTLRMEIYHSDAIGGIRTFSVVRISQPTRKTNITIVSWITTNCLLHWLIPIFWLRVRIITANSLICPTLP